MREFNFESKEIGELSKEILEYIDQNSKELFVENMGCWFLRYMDTIDAGANCDKFIIVCEMPIAMYMKAKDHCPCVYLGNGIVTEYCDYIEGYLFFPTVEFSNVDECYVKKENAPQSVMAIIGSFPPPYTGEKTETYNISKNTYLMIDGNGYTKIGKSSNPEYRERTLQSEKPTVRLIAIAEKDIEQYLHDKYSDKRVRGEWFSLTDMDRKQIIKDYDFKKVTNA